MNVFEAKMKRHAMSVADGLEAMLAEADLKIEAARQQPERPADFEEMVAKVAELRAQLSALKLQFADVLDG